MFLLTGCSSQTMEEVFHEEMNDHDIENYSMFYLHKDKAAEKGIVLYQTPPKKNTSLVYFKANVSKGAGDKWEWAASASCNQKWGQTTITDGGPYIYCGTVGSKYEKVLVDGEEAQMVLLDEAQIWYHLTGNKNAEGKAILVDGSEEWFHKD
ncbi:hypothetical protein [Salinibacillus aidingensis]